MKKYRIFVPIYEHYIHLSVVDKIDECSAYVDIYKEEKILHAVFQKDNITPHLIAHEVVHLVNAIFSFKGIKLDTENDESQAYLTEFIFKEIYKRIVK